MESTYIIHTKEGTQVLKASEIIRNAQEQEKKGIRPSFKYNMIDAIPAGWLVWSTWEDGAGVVYKRPEDGKYIIIKGWQGEFTCV